MKQMTGLRFGRWVVLEQVVSKKLGNSVRSFFRCLCDCGNIKEVSSNSLRRGKSQSCGCLHREVVSVGTHYMTNTKIYNRWKGMLDRCRNKNSKWFSYYGGRGINVCDRWKDFTNFITDMGHPPFEGATIERVDNDGDYCLDNCRWASRAEQLKNRRRKGTVVA